MPSAESPSVLPSRYRASTTTPARNTRTTRPHAGAPAALLLAVLILGGCSSGAHRRAGASSTTLAPADAITDAASACSQLALVEATLPAGARRKLEGACSGGAASAVEKAVREVCEQLIGRSTVPAGTARERALKACRGR